MTQPPPPGHGPGPQPGRDPGAPVAVLMPAAPPQPAAPAETRGWPGSPSTAPRHLPARPGARRAGRGPVRPGWRCDGATDDELIGLMSRWAAVESWAAAGKLGVTRELLRRRAVAVPGTVGADGLPEVWDNGTGHEVAAALAISLQGADQLANLAWTLQARLPGIGAKLADGTSTSSRPASSPKNCSSWTTRRRPKPRR